MSDWNEKIIEEFRANEGKIGGYFENMTLLLLHTTGAKSGLPRLNPAAYTKDKDRLVIIASKGGADTHPDWYYNLVANSNVIVEVGSDTYDAVATVEEEPERTRLYDQMAAQYSGYEEYRQKTTRIIPVITLQRKVQTLEGKMKPTHAKYETVETLKLFDGLTMKILLDSQKTNGLQAIFEDIVVPGFSLGRHIHHHQDETFLFLEGTFDVEVDGKLYRMTAGDVAFVPKGAVHTWKNVGSEHGRLRYIFSPALNIEEMFREFHKLRQAGEFSEAAMKKIAEKYPEQETVGPPL